VKARKVVVLPVLNSDKNCGGVCANILVVVVGSVADKR
jgi:hypothetical protein